MSWGFGGVPQSGGGVGGNAMDGGTLGEAVTRKLGFLAIAGDTKLRLLPSGWTNERPAAKTSSLLSIASNKGLIAAAGPDALVIAKTESVRQAFTTGQDENGVKTFTPEATIQVPRVSHVAFSADESCLVIAAEEGGGLAVYDTNALLQGNKEPAFQMATHGVAVRHLLPNPSQDFFNYFAIVLSDGKLVLADLKERKLVDSSSGGPVFRENVSCACWSKLGKQMVAGQADGSAVQIDPSGNVKAEIPRVPQLPALEEGVKAVHLTSIYWLETFEFLMIYSREVQSVTDATPPDDSLYYIARRDKASGSCTYQQFAPNICLPGFGEKPFGHQFVQRLKAWPPALDDTIFLANTISPDIGLVTKSKTPLQEDHGNPNQIVNAYTSTEIDDEIARRAGLPASVNGADGDPVTIGMALDLSDRQGGQPKPVPGDETIDISPTPLPALCVLNSEGIICIWWFVNTEAVQQNMVYPGLIAAQGQTPASAPSPAPAAATQTQSAFGQSAMTPPQPQKSAFGQSTFGQPSTPAFGGASMMGNKQSAWGGSSSPAPAAPASNQPTFGSSSAMGGGGGFGQAGGMGMNKPSVWGSGGSAAPAAGGSTFGQPSAFGSSGGGGMAGGSTFGQPSAPAGGAAGAGTENTPSGFASFAAKPGVSPFAGAGGGDAGSENKPAFSSFGAPSSAAKTPASPFGGIGSGENKSSGFGQLGGGSPSPFAAWARDNPAKDQPAVPNDNSFGSTATLGSNFSSFGKPSTMGKPSPFGTPSADSGSSTFGKPSNMSREETMGDDDSTPKPEDKPQNAFDGFKLGSTFKGDGSAKDDLPKPKDPGAGLFGSGFGQALGETSKEEEPATPVKPEPGTNEPKLSDIPEASFTPASPPKQAPKPQEDAPLPPDFTKTKPKETDDAPLPPDFTQSKAQVPDDAPLPPDFMQSKPKSTEQNAPPLPPDDAPLPPDFTKSRSKEGSDISEPPIAGSPPVDLGNERFSSVAGSNAASDGPPDDEDGSEQWSEEESGEEGSGEDGEGDGSDDDGEDGSEDEDSRAEDATQDAAKYAAFEARITPASPPKAQQKQTDDSTTPPTHKKDSYTPAGFPKGPVFAPPGKSNQDSPRSPSPVRAVTSPMSRNPPSPALKPAPKPRTYVQPTQPIEREPPAPRQPPPPTQSEIEDEEDDRIQDLLATTPEPTLEMPPFLAHQDYAGDSDKQGLGGSIEKVYRDVNSMIDTLGLNARNLSGYINGQTALRHPSDRSEDDLHDENLFTLAELPALSSLQNQISSRLEAGKLSDPHALLQNLHAEAKTSQRSNERAKVLRDAIRARTSPQAVQAAHEAPLPPDAAQQQLDLRRALREVQILLSRAEESASVLRADLAAAEAKNKRGGNGAAVPTVEAVTNTILKMTAMVQQKSGDVDVLEAQIRRLSGLAQRSLKTKVQMRRQRQGSLGGDYEDDLVGAMGGAGLGSSVSAAGKGFRTPPSRKVRPHVLDNPVGMGGMFGASTRSTRFQTPPPRGEGAAAFSPGASLLRNSVGAGAFSPGASVFRGSVVGRTPGSSRKKMGDVTSEEVEFVRGKRERRRLVGRALREAVVGEQVGVKAEPED